MKNKLETKVTIEDVSSQIIEETKLNFNCCLIFDHLGSDEFICEHQISLFKDDNQDINHANHIYYGNVEKSLISIDENKIYIHATVNIDSEIAPNKFKLYYRLFNEVDNLDLILQLPKQDKTCLINRPVQNSKNDNNWVAKGVEVNSFIIKNTGDGHFDYRYTITCSEPNERGLIFEFNRLDQKTSSDPIILKDRFLTKESNLQASENINVNCKIYKALNWQEFVYKTSFKTEMVSYDE